MSTPEPEFVPSWVATREEQHERQQHANRVVGLRLTAVRYVNLDYHRHEQALAYQGWRTIASEVEWANPTWRYDGFDAVDHAVELHFAEGRIFTVTWDSPGMREGVGFREQPLAGYAVAEEADVAVWDVTARSGWSTYRSATVTGVTLHYFPWDDVVPGFWCPRISLAFGAHTVHLLLGDTDVNGKLGPSADNIAVVFPPRPLPEYRLRAETTSAEPNAAMET